jgi:hypothetical protein
MEHYPLFVLQVLTGRHCEGRKTTSCTDCAFSRKLVSNSGNHAVRPRKVNKVGSSLSWNFLTFDSMNSSQLFENDPLKMSCINFLTMTRKEGFNLQHGHRKKMKHC